jgi:hypothetical protein
MDRINARIAQVYGYAVCLICVIVILVATHEVIDSAFNYAQPLESGTAYGRFGPLTSYDAYRIGMRQQMMMRSADARAAVHPDSTLSDAELHKVFESERDQQIGAARFRALRDIVSGIVFLVLASTLFLFHWRWIRRSNSDPAVN